MSAILNSLNAHNFLIFQPILMKLVSKFIVYKAFSDKTYLLLGLRSPSYQTAMIMSRLSTAILRDFYLTFYLPKLKQLTNTQVLSQFAVLCGGILPPFR